MKDWNMIHKIKSLFDNGNGLSRRQIAAQLKISRRTVNKYLSMTEDEITALYEYRSVIITTNKDFTNWNDFFIDENVAVPVIDRLIHHSHLFLMGGESYRLKNKLNR